MKKGNDRHYVHNGDVQALKVSELPKDAKVKNHEPLALGEKSGHMHVATGEGLQQFVDSKGNIYVVTGENGGMIQHTHKDFFNNNYGTSALLPKADHKPATLQPNSVYHIGIHKQFNPFQKVWEKVAD